MRTSRKVVRIVQILRRSGKYPWLY